MHTSYPSKCFLNGDHLLFHHHHQLDPFLVTHCDLTGHITDILSCTKKSKNILDTCKNSCIEQGTLKLDFSQCSEI